MALRKFRKMFFILSPPTGSYLCFSVIHTHTHTHTIRLLIGSQRWRRSLPCVGWKFAFSIDEFFIPHTCVWQQTTYSSQCHSLKFLHLSHTQFTLLSSSFFRIFFPWLLALLFGACFLEERNSKCLEGRGEGVCRVSSLCHFASILGTSNESDQNNFQKDSVSLRATRRIRYRTVVKCK